MCSATPCSLSSSMFIAMKVKLPSNSNGGGNVNVIGAWPRKVGGPIHSNLDPTKLVNTNHYDNVCTTSFEKNNMVNEFDKEVLFPIQSMRIEKKESTYIRGVNC